MKVQTNAQGKVYITSGGKALLSSGGSDTIYLPNNSGSTMTGYTWVGSVAIPAHTV